MTEEQVLALLVALHEQTAKQIANRILKNNVRSISGIDDLLRSDIVAEQEIIGEYLAQFGDDAIVNEPWNSGKTYRDTIAQSVERTRRDLEEVFMRGEEQLADEIFEAYMRRRTHETKQIAVTEETRIASAVTIKTYAYYRYLTAGGSRVCERCRPLEGMVFDTVDARIGENCPPIHPMCRCRIEPVR